MNPANPTVTLRTIILSCLMAMPAAAQDQSPPLNATPMPVPFGS